MKIKEHDIQKQIIDYLKLKHYFWWRNNSGAMISEYKGKKRFMRFGSVGSPDIFVIYKNDCYGIEIKSATGKQSPEQIEWQKGFDDNGGIYLLIRSLDELMDYL
jgi:hypothetical protein